MPAFTIEQRKKGIHLFQKICLVSLPHGFNWFNMLIRKYFPAIFDPRLHPFHTFPVEDEIRIMYNGLLN